MTSVDIFFPPLYHFCDLFNQYVESAVPIVKEKSENPIQNHLAISMPVIFFYVRVNHIFLTFGVVTKN